MVRIVVTGASGFLGSWVTRVLAKNHDVTALIRPGSDLFRISGIDTVELAKIPANEWPDFIRRSRPEILVLLDWNGVGNEQRNDSSQLMNIDRMLSNANAARESGANLVIGVGSQAELGPLDCAISEIALDDPTTAYGEAKVIARLALQKLLQGTETGFTWMRVFSTYGPLDSGSWFITNTVDTLLKNERMMMTKGEQKWSYLHAFDLAMAFKAVIEDTKVSGIVNVGNPNTITIREAGLKIEKTLGKENLLLFGALDYRSDQVMRLEPLCETLLSAGWNPQISFDEGIKQTIDWLQKKPLEPLKTLDGKTLDFKLPSRL